MRVIKLESLYKDMVSNRKRLIIMLVVFGLVFGLLGIRGIRKAVEKNNATIANYEKEYANYEKNLEEFDNSLATYKENLTTLEGQYERQADYCDNSVYMQMDGSDCYKAEVKIDIKDLEGAVNRSAVTGMLTTYVVSNAAIEAVANQMDGIEAKYLKELIGSSSTGTLITITVMHYDENAAEEILTEIENVLNNYSKGLFQDYGMFSLEKMSEGCMKYADINILNAQSSALNNLRSYRSSVSDMKNSISNKEQEKENYIKENEPAAVKTMGKLEKILLVVQYIIIGVVLALILLAICSAFKILFGKKLLDTDYLEAQGISVMGIAEDETTLRSVLVDMELTVKATGKDTVYLDLIEDTEEARALAEKAAAYLNGNGIKAVSGCTASGAEAELRQLCESDNTVLLIEKNMASYVNVDKVLTYIKHYNANALGTVLWSDWESVKA